MAEVRAVFTLTDRVSTRLDRIHKRAVQAELSLQKLAKTLNKLNREVRESIVALETLGKIKAKPKVDLDISAYRRKFSEVMAMQKILDNSIASPNVHGAGGGNQVGRYVANKRGIFLPRSMSAGGGSGAARQARRHRTSLEHWFSSNTSSSTLSGYYRYGRAHANPKSYTPGIADRQIRAGFVTAVREAANEVVSDAAEKVQRDFKRKRSKKSVDRTFTEILFGMQDKRRNPFMRTGRRRWYEGGTGGWFSGASLAVPLTLSGALSTGVGGAGALGAGAAALAPMLAALGGLGAVLGGTAIPLIAGTVEKQKNIDAAKEAIKNAETMDELREATEELRKAYAALTPIERSLIKDTERLKNVFTELTRPVRQNLANIYSNFTGMAEGLAPTLRGPTFAMGRAGEEISRRAASFMSNPQEIAMLKRFLTPLPQLAIDTAKALGQMAIWVERVVIAATPLATWMLKGINDYLGGIVQNTRGDGIDNWVSGFDRFRGVIAKLGHALDQTFQTLSRMFDDAIPLVEEFLDVFSGTFLESLEKVNKEVSKVVGPAVLGALEEVLKTIAILVPPIAQIIAGLAKIVEQLAAGFNKLNEMTNGWSTWLLVGLIAIWVVFKKIIGGGVALLNFIDKMKKLKAPLAGIFSNAQGPAKVLLNIVKGIAKFLGIAAAYSLMTGGGVIAKGGKGAKGGTAKGSGTVIGPKGQPIPNIGGTSGGGMHIPTPPIVSTPNTNPSTGGGGGGRGGVLGMLGRFGSPLGIGLSAALIGGSMFGVPGMDKIPSSVTNVANGVLWGSLFGPMGMIAGGGGIGAYESISHTLRTAQSGQNGSWLNPLNWTGNVLNSFNPFSSGGGGMSASDSMAALQKITAGGRNVFGVTPADLLARNSANSSANTTPQQQVFNTTNNNSITAPITVNEATDGARIANMITTAIANAISNMPQSAGSNGTTGTTGGSSTGTSVPDFSW
jgi:hypothetical protein